MAAGPGAPATRQITMGQQTRPGLWRFGAVELDERLATVRIGDHAVDLDRSSYDILLALLRHNGEVVTKDELLEAGWPGRVVSENSLAKAVSRLRQALAADGASVRVVHGYGYRLTAPVTFAAVAPDSVAVVPHEAARLRAGDRLPQRPGWRLERRLGEGAAGVIFLATSDQGGTRAIKLSTSEPGLRSLKREIALSRYIRSVRDDCACVAPVLGWNLSHPPFFLELPYYEAGNLRDWGVERGGLASVPLEQRLQLAIQLCDAVAELHEMGVIHRDLKPENIYPVADAATAGGWRLVLGDLGASDAASTPQLAELGITMSLLDSTSGDGSPRYPGSLLYMAPEVVAGELPTQRSDVFALGVLVYQLAVGDLRRSLAPGWEADAGDALLCEDIGLAAAAQPGRRGIDARTLAQHLRTLDARRDARAREHERLAQERRREQLAARDRSRLRWGLAVSVALAAGLAGTATMYSRAEQARRQAEDQARQRQAVLDFVTGDILGQADPYAQAGGGARIPLLTAVERAAARVDAQLADDPASAAAVHAMVGSVYFAQDRHPEAIARFDRARALYRGLGQAQAGALTRVETQLCDVHRIAGDLARAGQACQSAWQRARRSGDDLALATLKLGQLRGEQNRDRESLALLRPLLAAGAFRDDHKAQGELRWALGLAERGLGRFEAARGHFEVLLALYSASGGRSTWTAWALNSLGSVLVETGEYDKAETLLVEARRIFGSTQGAGQVEAQMPDIWRGEIRLRRQQWDEAATIEQALIEAWRGALKPDHPLLLKATANLAWAEAAGGRHAAARARLDAAMRDRAVVFDRPGARIAQRTARWARAALALGDDARAGELLRLLDAALVREYPDAHPLRGEAACLQARWSLARGEHVRAREHAQACSTMLAGFLDAGHPLRQEALALLEDRPGGPGQATGLD